MLRTYRLTESDLYLRRWPLPERRVPLDSIAWRYVDRFKGTLYLSLETKDGKVVSVSDFLPSGKHVYHELYRRLSERGIPQEPASDSKLGRRLKTSAHHVFYFFTFLALINFMLCGAILLKNEPLEHLMMPGGCFVLFGLIAALAARQGTI